MNMRIKKNTEHNNKELIKLGFSDIVVLVFIFYHVIKNQYLKSNNLNTFDFIYLV